MNIIDSINFLEKVKSLGRVVIIKMDGEREEKQYVVTIGFPRKPQNSISFQGEELESVLDQVVSTYKSKYEL